MWNDDFYGLLILWSCKNLTDWQFQSNLSGGVVCTDFAVWCLHILAVVLPKAVLTIIHTYIYL